MHTLAVLLAATLRATRRLAGASSLVGLMLMGPGAAVAAPQGLRVLLIQGGDPYSPSAMAQMQGVRNVFRAGEMHTAEITSEPLQLLEEDPSEGIDDLTVAQLKTRYGRQQPDVVIALRRPALDFLQRVRANLWPDVPIVFCGVAEEDLADIALGPAVSGVAMRVDAAGTLALARKLVPAATQLAIVAGASSEDRAWQRRLAPALAASATGLNIVWLGDGPIHETVEAVAALPSSAIVLYTSIARDGDEVVFMPPELVPQLSTRSKAPIFSFFDTYLGNGIVGGKLSSWQKQGEAAASLAIERLSGMPSKDEGSVRLAPPPVAMVDWRQLQRHSLDEAALPAGTEVRYREPDFLSRHRTEIGVLSVLIALQGIAIAALIASRRRARAAEHELVAQRDALSHVARLSTLGELTASISHEVNQPLGAILASADTAELLLQKQPPNIDETLRIITHIKKAGVRAGEVTNRVRSMVRRHQIEPVLLDINGLIAETWPLVEGTVRRNGVPWEHRLEPWLPLVYVDKGEMQQVLLNLILNALDAMRATPAEERRLLVSSARIEDDAIRIAIADTGHGLEGDQQRMFEAFFTTKPDGMGLGLSIARSIVDAHGGTLSATGHAPRGAIFSFTIPVAKQQRWPGETN